MLVDKLHNKSFTISEIYKGYLITRVFYGYSLKEGKKLFKEYLKTIN
jgi:hypothetical protein